MRYRVLGPLQFWHEDHGWLTIKSAKGRILLASLLAQANTSVSKELIRQHLWTEITPPRSAPKLIHFYVHQVRRAIGDHHCSMLRTSPSGYKLTVRSGDRDIDLFLEAAARGRAELRAGHLPRAADWFRQGLLLWHGSPYVDLLETELGRIESATLMEQLLLVKEATYDIALRVGRDEEIIPELRGLVLAHPLRERFYEQLMAAQHLAGRRVDALRTFDDLRCVLGRELGIAPGRVAQELHGMLLMNPPDAVAVVRSALGVSAPPP